MNIYSIFLKFSFDFANNTFDFSYIKDIIIV